jgi:hypothetical protein
MSMFMYAAILMLVQAGQLDVEGRQALISQLEAVVERTVPGAQLETMPVPARRSYEARQWNSPAGRFSVKMYIKESVEAAELAFARMRHRPAPSVRVKGYGDDAYLFQHYSPFDERLILFRQGRLLLEVSAIGDENVRRLAALFAAEARKVKLDDPDRVGGPPLLGPSGLAPRGALNGRPELASGR